jgi:hypothetical protein
MATETLFDHIKQRGFPYPSYRRGWQYLGQGFLDWPDKLQVELLADNEGKINARVLLWNPFGNEGDCGYLLNYMKDVMNNINTFLDYISLVFSDGKNLEFCLEFSKLMLKMCERKAKKGEFKESFIFENSKYQNKLDKLVEGLQGVGLSQVNKTTDGNKEIVTVDWFNTKDATDIEQVLMRSANEFMECLINS